MNLSIVWKTTNIVIFIALIPLRQRDFLNEILIFFNLFKFLSITVIKCSDLPPKWTAQSFPLAMAPLNRPLLINHLSENICFSAEKRRKKMWSKDVSMTLLLLGERCCHLFQFSFVSHLNNYRVGVYSPSLLVFLPFFLLLWKAGSGSAL